MLPREQAVCQYGAKKRSHFILRPDYLTARFKKLLTKKQMRGKEEPQRGQNRNQSEDRLLLPERNAPPAWGGA